MCHFTDTKVKSESALQRNEDGQLGCQQVIVVRFQSYRCERKEIRCASSEREQFRSLVVSPFRWHYRICVSPGVTSEMEQGKYTVFFVSLAVIMDVIGLIFLLIGIFAPLSYWDFFVFSGPLLIFLSLVPWIFWYMGNLTVSEEELNLAKSDILWPDRSLSCCSAWWWWWGGSEASEIMHSWSFVEPWGDKSNPSTSRSTFD